MRLKTTKLRSRFLTPGMLLLLTLASGCSQSLQKTSEATQSPTPLSFPSPLSPASPATPAPASDPLVDAEDAAQGAISLTQSAVSSEDWKIIAQQWERAIAMLESVPESDPKIAAVRDKLAGYKQNLAYARQQAQQNNSQSQQPASNLPPPGIIAVTGSPSEGKSEKAPSTTNETSKQPTNSGNASPSQRQSNTPQNDPANPKPAATGNTNPKLALAQHLTDTGAKMFGTFWCGACQYQREEFGEAFNQVVEIECDPRGKNPQTDLCQQAGIKAFPTWQVNGQLYQGVRSLDELAELSGYSGDRNFSP